MMNSRRVVISSVWLASLHLLAVPASGDSLFVTPAPRMIELLRSEHLGHVLDLSTATATYAMRVDSVGIYGLAGVNKGKGSVPLTLGWGEIARIERRYPPHLATVVFQSGACAIAGAYVGSLVGATDGDNWLGAAVGGGVGFMLRGAGRREMLYSGIPATRGFETPMTMVPTAGPNLKKVGSQIGKLIRIRGRFGEIVGRAGSITVEGVSGLAADSLHDGRLPLPAQPIPWSDISRVDARVSCAGRGALIGAVVFGGFVGTIAGGLTASGLGLSSGGSSGDVAAAAALGALAGGLLGTLPGAFFGSLFHRWRPVYEASTR